MPTIAPSVRLTELERQWYQVRVPNATAQTPLGEIQAAYWRTKVGANYKTHAELERAWLKEVIVAQGAIPTTTATVAQLWNELARALGFSSVFSRRDAQKSFYSSVTTSP